MIQDLEETFASLRQVHLRLNLEKCVFGVPSGKLLGFLVSHRGIEANPKKIKAIEDMSPPQTLKEMQKLADTSILHQAFISIFITLWVVITRYVTILMAILSYFTRFT